MAGENAPTTSKLSPPRALSVYPPSPRKELWASALGPFDRREIAGKARALVRFPERILGAHGSLSPDGSALLFASNDKRESDLLWVEDPEL